MKYEKFRYIYPPRPKNAVPPSDIGVWDNGSLLAQLKFNGSNCTIYTNGVDVRVYNRHNQRMTNFNLTKDELLKLHVGEIGSWVVINGEYMNKSKKDEKGLPFNHKLVVFDILVLNSDHLVGKTFQERVDILDDLYGTVESEKPYLWRISENIYRVKTYYTGFDELFNNFTKIDMIEGIVGKRKKARLEVGTSETNNHKSQVKFRKPTNNYRY